MGAVTSSQIQDTFSQILSEEPLNTLLSDEIHSLTYQQFLELLGELNLLSKECLDANGNKLVFAVKKDTDSTIFWKSTVQIACVKVNPQTEKVDAFRLFRLGEFLKVFKTLKSQMAAAEDCNCKSGPSHMTISNLFDEVDLEKKSGGSEEPNECCICFERKHEVILPCAHSYCLPCIQEWNEAHDTCPICREKLDSTDDTWVMSEVPKAEEISKEIRNSLLKLTDDRSPTCTPS